MGANGGRVAGQPRGGEQCGNCTVTQHRGELTVAPATAVGAMPVDGIVEGRKRLSRSKPTRQRIARRALGHDTA